MFLKGGRQKKIPNVSVFDIYPYLCIYITLSEGYGTER